VSRLGSPYGKCFDPTSKNFTRNVYEELYPIEYSETVSSMLPLFRVFCLAVFPATTRLLDLFRRKIQIINFGNI